MNICVIKEELTDDAESKSCTGGEYAITTLEIHLDRELSFRTQQHLTIHAIIEDFCRSWPHDKIEALMDNIQEAIDQLEENKDG